MRYPPRSIGGVWGRLGMPGNRRFSLSIVALAAVLWGGNPAMAENSYLRGDQLVDLYKHYIFCYDPRENTCSSIEVIDSNSPKILRIRNERLVRFRKEIPDSPGDAIIDILSSKTALNPEGYERDDVQTLDIIPNGLCRSIATEVQDDYMMSALMVPDLLNPSHGQFSADPEDVAAWRENHARHTKSQIGNNYCSRYMIYQTQANLLFPVPTYLAGEYLFIDEAQQSGARLVKLYPKDGWTSLTLRAP